MVFDLDILKSRTVVPDYPHNALHEYRLNADIDKRNEFMLNNMASEDQEYVIEASDAVATRYDKLAAFQIKGQ